MSGVAEMTIRGRVAFCASARTGLGHLRRVTNIASQLKRRFSGIEICLVTNAPPDGIAAHERALFTHVVQAERREMARRLASMDLDIVAVDTAVVPDIELIPQRLALILRETIDARLSAFRLPAGRSWDAVIVAEPEDGWTVDPGHVGADAVRNVGWISRVPTGRRGVLGPKDERPVVLVATGGGGTPAAGALADEIDEVIGRARALSALPYRVVQVLGPRADASARLASADAVVDVGPQLDEAFAEADAIVSTSGYNSILELAATTTPALLLAVPRTYDDQSARSRQWGPRLGLAHVGGECTRSATWLAAVVQGRRRRSPARHGDEGAARAADVIAGLVRSDCSGTASRCFVKRVGDTSTASAADVARRSRLLFARGVPTPPAIHVDAGEAVAFARLAGPTARDIWVAERATRPLGDRARPVVAAIALLHAADPAGLDLRPLDPTRRITPRLRPDGRAWRLLGPARVEFVSRLVARLAAECAASASNDERQRIVHGDLHLGQLIRPDGRDGYVIVDLDDLALGSPESDLGNLAANIATGVDLHPGTVAVAFDATAAVLARVYGEIAGFAVDTRAVRRHGAIALVRRGLKCLERGGSVEMAEEVLAAAEDLAGQPRAEQTADVEISRAKERALRCA